MTLTTAQQAKLTELAALEVAALMTTERQPTLEVALPLTVVSRINRGGHWSATAKAAKKHRQAAAMKLRAELRRRRFTFARAVVQLVRVRPVGLRGLDDDNLRGGFKAVRDGVADALGIDDGDARVRWLYAEVEGERYGVVIRVWSWQ